MIIADRWIQVGERLQWFLNNCLRVRRSKDEKLAFNQDECEI